jgi:methylated-DNA-[protein]-cysteine S-methyltransferase
VDYKVSPKECFIEGKKGFPGLCIRFAGNTIIQAKFSNLKNTPKRPFILSKEENLFLNSIKQDFIAYFHGKPVNFNKYKIKTDSGTSFHKKVWKELKAIPYGKTRSYGWIAKKIGKPKAARVVGQACGRNPVSILQPCHRVVSADGSLGGFSGGVSLKRKLLMLEGVILP